jgi:hypothetical protein
LAASVAVFYVFGRYRYPLVPLLTLFAGAGIVESYRLYRQRAWRALAPAVILAIAIATLINWPLQKDSGAGAAGYNNLANALAKQGKVEKRSDCEQALKVQPVMASRHNLGNLYMQRPLDWRGAISKRRSVVPIMPMPNNASCRRTRRSGRGYGHFP